MDIYNIPPRFLVYRVSASSNLWAVEPIGGNASKVAAVALADVPMLGTVYYLTKSELDQFENIITGIGSFI